MKRGFDKSEFQMRVRRDQVEMNYNNLDEILLTTEQEIRFFNDTETTEIYSSSLGG